MMRDISNLENLRSSLNDKKKITKNKSIKMSLALLAIAMSILLGCPSNDKSTKNGGGGPTDATAPTLTSSVPVSGATNINASLNIILSYNEPVQAGTGNITLTPTMPTGGMTFTIDVTDAQVSISGAVLTINPTNSLAVSTTYTLTVPAGAIVDASGNTAADVTLSFSTAANIVPVVISSVPVADGIDFPINSAITLTFSEAVQKGDTGGVVLNAINVGSTHIPIESTKLRISTDGTVVTVTPLPWLEGTAYTLSFLAGVFVSSTDQTPAPAFSLDFTTIDTISPTLQSTIPPANSMDFSANANITFTYNEPVQAGTGNITLTPTMPTGGMTFTIDVTDAQVSISGAVLTINPSADLELSTEYTLTIPAGAIVDASGNAGSLLTLSFSTAADLTPMVISSVPVGDGIIDSAASIVLTYSEAVKVGTGNISIRVAGGGDPITIAVTDTTQVTIVGAVVTINPTDNLEPSAKYALIIPDAAIQDLADNPAPEHILFFDTAE